MQAKLSDFELQVRHNRGFSILTGRVLSQAKYSEPAMHPKRIQGTLVILNYKWATIIVTIEVFQFLLSTESGEIQWTSVYKSHTPKTEFKWL